MLQSININNGIYLSVNKQKENLKSIIRLIYLVPYLLDGLHTI